MTIGKILLKINSTASKALISCGAFDYFRKNRTEMLFEYELCAGLTNKEQEYFLQLVNAGHTKIRDIFDQMLLVAKINKNRKSVIADMISSIDHPAYSLLDKVEWLSDCESNLLGVAISCSKLDSYDIGMTNTNCKEFKQSSLSHNIIIAGEISNVNVTKTKNGKNPGLDMAFLSIEDQFGLLDSVIFFPETYAKYMPHLFEGNILIFVGGRSKSKDSFVVEKCFVPAT
jgi:DNA polymerase III alpha subunit